MTPITFVLVCWLNAQGELWCYEQTTVVKSDTNHVIEVKHETYI